MKRTEQICREYGRKNPGTRFHQHTRTQSAGNGSGNIGLVLPEIRFQDELHRQFCINELPKTGSRKIYKKVLRDPYLK